MIFVDRERLSNGRAIHPGAEWQSSADAATEAARAQGGRHVALDGVYGSDSARAALEELTSNKCAYCESSLDRFNWDVEHFRPKGRVKERPEHPGYYWLAYSWTNLLPSCTVCNQNRKEKPVFDGTPTAGTGGKLDQFPLADEAMRSMDHLGDLSRERPLIIDPSSEDPETMLGYLPNGGIFALDGSEKAKTSIRVFRLDLVRIRRERRKKVDLLVQALKLRRKVQPGGEAEALVQGLCDTLAASDKTFAGFVRYFLKNPAALGLDA